MSNDELGAEGQRRCDAGIRQAASHRVRQVMLGRLAMLEALLRSPSGTGTLNDATPRRQLATAYKDGGCWRGAVTRSLAVDGYIERVAYELSDRPSRHRAPIAVWSLVDRAAANQCAERLRAALYHR